MEDRWRVHFRNHRSAKDIFVDVLNRDSALQLACAPHPILTVLHIEGPNGDYIAYDEIMRWQDANKVQPFPSQA